jgi:hypothetical protein
MRLVPYLTLALIGFSPSVHATTFLFNTEPFAGTTALTTPGRQVIGGESFITFDVAADVFAVDKGVFGVDEIHFLNDLSSNVPGSGVNTIVLQNSDVPFAAGIAASLLAAQITEPGPGFFIYFNSGLDLPRFVYSTDLSDPNADLKVLARLTNLSGAAGRAQLPNFTVGNFAAVPEPSSLLLTLAGGLAGFGLIVRRKRTRI